MFWRPTSTPKGDAMTAAAKPAMPRRLRWLLIGSLTLNLLVVGVVAGTALRFAGSGGYAERTLGFGPWSHGLTHEDMSALREAYRASGEDFRAAWREERADRTALVAALRAEPFDLAAMDAITARMAERGGARAALGQRLIREHIAAMSPEARRALAERMEAGPRRSRAGGHDQPRPRGSTPTGD